MTLENWLSILREIRSTKSEFRRFHNRVKDDGTLSTYCVNNDWWGFPGPDTTAAIRLILEIIPNDAELIYDVTELVGAGYFNLDDDLVKVCRDYMSSDHQAHSKVIILTEGKFDSFVLSESIKILYPHLLDYFSFLDYDSARIGGGVGSLANMVKSFSGVGIVNKMVAIFDNDTAAHAALRSLSQVNIPDNIQVLTLPEIELLNSYPTLGPNGMVDMNVNGMAGSIEAYLGMENLKDKNRKYFPVQWTGLESSLQKYQGEITEKVTVQKRFREQLKNVDEDITLVGNYDWSGIHIILTEIFKAFHHYDNKLHESWVEHHYS